MGLSAAWERAIYLSWGQDTVNGSIAVPAVQDYNVVLRLPWPGVIKSITGKLSAGTATATLKINAAAIANLSAMAWTTTSLQTIATPGAASTVFAEGDALVLTLTAVGAPGILDFTVNWQRTGK